MFKRFWSITMLLVVFILVSCANDDDVEGDIEGDNDETANEEANDLVIGMINEPVSMDPHTDNDIPSAQLRTQLYDTLVNQDLNMEIGDGLAENYEQVEDDVWSFQLKDDVTFHNGSEFTAEDVEATFERLLDPTVASSVMFMFEMVNDIEVVNDHEVHFHTDYPFAPLLSHLAHNTAGILSKEIIDEDYQNAIDEADLDITLDEYYDLREEDGEEFEEVSSDMADYIGEEIAEHPDGTNHLMLQERDPGNEYIFEKFDDFHGGEREFNTVTYRVIPENQARLAELETGGIAVTDNVNTESMERVDEHEDTEMVNQDGLSMSYLAFNYDKEPFDDENVRQAISHAIDRDQILTGVLDNKGTHASTHISPTVIDHDENAEEVPFDIDLAQEYLDESSEPDGFDTTLWVSDSEEVMDIALLIQEGLDEIGINVEIEQFEFGAFLEKAEEGTHDMFMLQWITITGDPDYGLYPMFHTDSQDGSGNRWLYSNPELDDVLDEGRQSTDEAEREELYVEAQSILMEDLPVTPLYYEELNIGVNNTLVEGIELDPVGIIRLEDISFPE